MNLHIRSVAVLGAGVSGLACSLELARAGVAVTLLDKGRRPGGRVATRREQAMSFNHGAQFATARGAEFRAVLNDLQSSGRAAPWTSADPFGTRIVFLPGMSALPRAMAEQAAVLGVTLLQERHAAFLHAADSGWTVRHMPADEMRPGTIAISGGELSVRHDAVLLALPSSQAGALLEAALHPFAEAAARAVIAPCWAVMARFPFPVPGRDVLPDLSGAISWAAREGSRPGRAAGPDALTVQASAAWSRAHLNESAPAAADALVGEFRAHVDAGTPSLLLAHRWRYARVETAIGQPSLWDPERRVGLCGDWLMGNRIEAAYDSGVHLARSVHFGEANAAVPGAEAAPPPLPDQGR